MLDYFKVEVQCLQVLVLLMSAFTSMIYCNGQPRILFSAKLQTPSKFNATLVDSDVTLLCETEGSPAIIQIKRLGDETPLNTSYGGQQSLEYQVRRVACDDMDTYVCVVDQSVRQTTDIIISDCNPRPCPGDDPNKTIFVDSNQTVQFDLCIISVGLLENVKFNNTTVRKKTSSIWTWDYQEHASTPDTYRRITVSVMCAQMSREEYGLLNIRVYSIIGQSYYLDFKIWLQSPGAPECPTEVNTTSLGQDYVLLSWRPGLNGGSAQTFHVYISKDNIFWNRHDVSMNKTSLIIKELEVNTRYFISVVSSNEYRTVVNPTICNNTLVTHTMKSVFGSNLHPSSIYNSGSQANQTVNPDNTEIHNNILYISFIICPVLLFILALLVLAMWIQRVRKRKQLRHREELSDKDESQPPSSSNHSSRQKLSNCRSISHEGLTYITVSHSLTRTKRKKGQEKKQRKEEKIEYTVLDFLKTGQKQCPEGNSIEI